MKTTAFWALGALILVTTVCNAGWAQRQFPTLKPEGELNTLTAEEEAQGWELLFDGESFDGWFEDGGEWSIEDGVIVSTNGTGHLFSEETYKNFYIQYDVCTYDVRIPKQRFGNSGVFVRGQKTDGAWPAGYEVQVDPYDINNPTGGIYGRARGTLLVDEEGNWKPEAFFDVHEGKWQHFKVLCIDNHIMIWVNGELTLDWIDEDNAFPDAGHIALQNHHGSDVVLFTNIKIKTLD